MKRKGFIDLQVNGYLGVDFSSMELSLDGIRTVTEALVRAFTVGYCATIITSAPEVYRRNLPLLAKSMEEPGIKGRLLGVHLEGPYLSPEDGARGAHQADLMRFPSIEEFDRFQDWAAGNIKILTLAPERKGALELCRHISRNHNTRISLGHHLASSSRIAEAVDAGATLVTHLGNGCPSLLPRHDNVINHQLANDALSASLITDGHHLPEDFIRIAFRCKGADRILVISDQAPIAGLSPGGYRNLGQMVQLSATGRISTLNTPYLAGSGRTMSECMRHLRSLGILVEEELWQVGFENPLKLLGTNPSEFRVPGLPDFVW